MKSSAPKTRLSSGKVVPSQIYGLCLGAYRLTSLRRAFTRSQQRVLPMGAAGVPLLLAGLSHGSSSDG